METPIVCFLLNSHSKTLRKQKAPRHFNPEIQHVHFDSRDSFQQYMKRNCWYLDRANWVSTVNQRWQTEFPVSSQRWQCLRDCLDLKPSMCRKKVTQTFQYTSRSRSGNLPKLRPDLFLTADEIHFILL